MSSHHAVGEFVVQRSPEDEATRREADQALRGAGLSLGIKRFPTVTVPTREAKALIERTFSRYQYKADYFPRAGLVTLVERWARVTKGIGNTKAVEALRRMPPSARQRRTLESLRQVALASRKDTKADLHFRRTFESLPGRSLVGTVLDFPHVQAITADWEAVLRCVALGYALTVPPAERRRRLVREVNRWPSPHTRTSAFLGLSARDAVALCRELLERFTSSDVSALANLQWQLLWIADVVPRKERAEIERMLGDDFVERAIANRSKRVRVPEAERDPDNTQTDPESWLSAWGSLHLSRDLDVPRIKRCMTAGFRRANLPVPFDVSYVPERLR